MEQFIRFIDKELPDQRGNEILYKFKRLLLDEMNSRYIEVAQRGISDTKVISDLIISEHPDVKKEYKAYYLKATEKSRARRSIILNVGGSIIYILCLIIAFLGMGSLTNKWGDYWLIIVDGILLWCAYLLTLGVSKLTSMNRFFRIAARVLLAFDVMVVSVAIFLYSLVMIGFMRSWVIVIAGVAAMLIADAVYVSATKRKLAIITHLVYIPIIATMLYIILAGLGILAWSTGWQLIIFSLVLDFIIMIASVARNNRYKHEVIDSWQEN